MKRQLLILITLAISTTLFALPNDATQQIRVESNSFHMEVTKGMATYVGKVIADQGTRHLTSDKLTIFRNKAGKVNKLVAIGKPAHFKTLPKPNGNWVVGHANTIIYQPLINLVTLIDNAYIMQDGNKFNGPQLLYNTQTQVVTSPDSPKGRSVMYLEPIQNEKKHHGK